jgi:hypothetical protein
MIDQNSIELVHVRKIISAKCKKVVNKLNMLGLGELLSSASLHAVGQDKITIKRTVLLQSNYRSDRIHSGTVTRRIADLK